ncbi:MAG: beta-ketoacyl synthase N-terminal-like domain-containing protein [Phocaeicola sp.]
MEREMGATVRKVYCSESAIISSLGITTKANYEAVELYKTALSRYTDGTPVCLIDRTAFSTKELEAFPFAEQIAIGVLENVISHSGVSLDDTRSLLILSTTKGNVDLIQTDFERAYLSALAHRVATYLGAVNEPIVLSNACVSGVEAILVGARLIEQAEYDNVFVVGVDVVSDFVVAGFNAFRTISPAICKPYDLSRDGLTLGEGAAALLLTADESLSTSKVIVAGGGMSCDANHISGPSRTGDGLVLAIQAALGEAKLSAREISFVNTHGTATPFNDDMESKALHLTELTSAPCNSLKPYLGHTLGASGVIEVILSLEQLKNNCVFGIKGYEQNGVPFPLNVEANHRSIELHHCLKIASGFGGTNAAIVLSKELTVTAGQKEDSPAFLSTEATLLAEAFSLKNGYEQVEIIERASVLIEKGSSSFTEYIRNAYKELGKANLKFFKMDDLCKLGYVASCQLMEGVELSCTKERVAIVLASKSGSLHTDLMHQSIVDKHLPEGASPAIFVYTLANIVAAEIAIQHKFKGELIFFIQDRKKMDYLSDYAKQLIQSNRCDAVLYGWCELLKEEYQADLKFITKK